jgi:hypothetical protein
MTFLEHANVLIQHIHNQPDHGDVNLVKVRGSIFIMFDIMRDHIQLAYNKGFDMEDYMNRSIPGLLKDTFLLLHGKTSRKLFDIVLEFFDIIMKIAIEFPKKNIAYSDNEGYTINLQHYDLRGATNAIDILANGSGGVSYIANMIQELSNDWKKWYDQFKNTFNNLMSSINKQADNNLDHYLNEFDQPYIAQILNTLHQINGHPVTDSSSRNDPQPQSNHTGIIPDLMRIYSLYAGAPSTSHVHPINLKQHIDLINQHIGSIDQFCVSSDQQIIRTAENLEHYQSTRSSLDRWKQYIEGCSTRTNLRIYAIQKKLEAHEKKLRL